MNAKELNERLNKFTESDDDSSIHKYMKNQGWSRIDQNKDVSLYVHPKYSGHKILMHNDGAITHISHNKSPIYRNSKQAFSYVSNFTRLKK